MQNGELIEGLNYALNREISTMVRYIIQSSSIQGMKNHPLREVYRKEVPDELGHAQYLADKIVMLGGKPQIEPDLSSPAGDVAEMIQRDVDEEEKDVRHYQKLSKMAEQAGDIELKLKLEEQAADEARHAEELRRLQG